MPATVRLGTCSWADEGLLKAWYPRGVSTPQARLRYYAERFDVVEVDSPFYALPDPDVTRRWAERTPDEFTFHVKAGAAMTFHEGEPTDAAFAAFRGSVEPLELSGKLRGVLMQYHPRFVKSKEAKDELARVRGAARAARAARRVPPPLVDGSRRALRHARVPRGARPRLRVGRRAADARHERRARASRRRRIPSRVIRFHGRNAQTWNIRGGSAADRFDWMYSDEELAEWVGADAAASPSRRTRSTPSSTTTATTSRRGAR